MAQKILIVDDEPSICSGLKMSLETEGYSVDVAFSGKTGLDNCKKITPDVTVLDLRLPDIDGIVMLKEIKEIDEDIIVIMITAFGDTRDAVEAVKNGAYDFITKPFDVNELKISINRALKERTLKNENTILKAPELPLELTDEKTSVSPPTSGSASLSLEELEKHHISQVMDMTRWNITKAAELLGISRFALQRRIKKYFG